MTIESYSEKRPLIPPPPPNWGEIAPEGQTAAVVRFALADRVVTFPVGEFRRWEHAAGETELLTITAGREQIIIEGRELAAVRAALDLGRLCELRINYPRPSGSRPGPRVHRITIEPA